MQPSTGGSSPRFPSELWLQYSGTGQNFLHRKTTEIAQLSHARLPEYTGLKQNLVSNIIDDQSKRMLRKVFFLLFLFVAYASFAWAGDIRVMVSGGFTAAYREIIPGFERATHNTVATAYGASM